MTFFLQTSTRSGQPVEDERTQMHTSKKGCAASDSNLAAAGLTKVMVVLGDGEISWEGL